jgi:Na+-transporting methylmalonyl-CoA/oxaloacetate decarboxylase gamma subunit
MEILRALIVTIIGVFLLMTLWPLFVFLVLVFFAYWVFISIRLRKMGETIRQSTSEPTPPTSQDPNVIDVEYTERKE